MGTESLDIFDTLSNVESTSNQLGFLNVPTGVDLYRPKTAGPCSLIILPYVTKNSPYVDAGRQFYFRDYYVFRGLGATKKGRYLDHAKTFKERCAITDSLAGYAGDPKEKPRSQRVALVNVIVVTEGKRTRAVMDFSYANFLGRVIDDIKQRIEKNPKKYDNLRFFADPERGVQIDFMWTEESMPNGGSKFFCATAFDYDPHGGVSDEVAHAVDLDNMFAKLTYKQVQETFLGFEHEEPDTPAEEAPAVAKVETTPAPATKAAEKSAPKPKATKPTTPAPEAPAHFAEAAKFSKGDAVMFEGRVCKVYKVVADVITLMDEAKDDFIKANADQLTPVPKATKKEEPVAAVAASGDEDAAWDADWAT